MDEFELNVVLNSYDGSNYRCILYLNSSGEASITFPDGKGSLLMQNCVNSPLFSWSELKYYKKKEFKNLEVNEDNILDLKKKIASIPSADRPKLVSDVHLWFEAGTVTVKEYGNRSVKSERNLNSPFIILLLIKELRKNFSHLENNF